MPDDRTHRWRNSPRLGGTFFVTTTTLDRAHRFPTPEAKDAITRSLLQTSLVLDARLTHYVVLSNHLHLLAHLPETLTVSEYMRDVKVDAHARHGEKGPLWRPGFRAVRIQSQRAEWVKTDYIHNNPLKYGLAERAEDYKWSSAHALANGCLDEWNSLDLRKAMNLYAR